MLKKKYVNLNSGNANVNTHIHTQKLVPIKRKRLIKPKAKKLYYLNIIRTQDTQIRPVHLAKKVQILLKQVKYIIKKDFPHSS